MLLMMILAQRIRWSGSAFRSGIRLLVVFIFLGLTAGCSHAPVEKLSAGERDNAAMGMKDKGGIHFSVHAPDAESVTLVLMRTLVSTPATFEVHARKGSSGIWAADFDLIPGEYRYFFIVNGSMTVVGESGRVEQDDFGGLTGVLTVRQTPEGILETF
jgi:hypothetical protein